MEKIKSVPVTYAIYINDHCANFTGMILDGIKTYETRTRRTLHRLIGQRVAIIRTGKGPAQIVGYATITGCIECHSAAEYDKYMEQCKLSGTPFEWNQDTTSKYLYRIEYVERCEPYQVPTNVIKHGRTYVEFKEEDAPVAHTINIHAFRDQYNKEYRFLYDHCDNVAGYDEAVVAFDDFAKAHQDFVSGFCTFIGDFISSDREAAAFMFALETMSA